MATTNWFGDNTTDGTIQFSNGSADQLWVCDTATTATAGTYTNITTATTADIIWPSWIGNQTRTNIQPQPYEQMNLRVAQPGEFTVNPRIQDYRNFLESQEPRTTRRMCDDSLRRTPAEPAEPTPQIIANARGQDLLKDIIGDVMYRRYQKQGWIDVRSADKPEIMYRIQPWHEIALLERNAKKEWVSNNQSICIHARQTHVEGDEVAAHVMLCRYDEKLLWKMGNLHGVRRAA